MGKLTKLTLPDILLLFLALHECFPVFKAEIFILVISAIPALDLVEIALAILGTSVSLAHKLPLVIVAAPPPHGAIVIVRGKLTLFVAFCAERIIVGYLRDVECRWWCSGWLVLGGFIIVVSKELPAAPIASVAVKHALKRCQRFLRDGGNPTEQLNERFFAILPL
jgi:hypothetical protein